MREGAEEIGITQMMTKLNSDWDQVLGTYADRNWARSLDMLKAFSANYPEDIIAKIYIDRVVEFLSKPPLPKRDGIMRFDKK